MLQFYDCQEAERTFADLDLALQTEWRLRVAQSDLSVRNLTVGFTVRTNNNVDTAKALSSDIYSDPASPAQSLAKSLCVSEASTSPGSDLCAPTRPCVRLWLMT